MLRNLGIFLGSLTLTCVLSACGGGGSDGSTGPIGGSPPPPPAQPAAITEANAQQIAGVAMQQVLSDGFFTSLTSAGIPALGSGSLAGQELISLVGPQLPPGVSAASIPQDCDVDGTVDIQVTISNPATISIGDEFIFNFDNCDDGLGTVISGGLGMTITGVGGDPNTDQFLLGISLSLSAFTITQDGETVGASGDLSIEIDALTPGVTTITVSASTFTSTGFGGAETVTDLQIVIVEDNSTFPTSVSVSTSFGLSSSRLPGDIFVSTSINLLRSGSDFPFSGEVTVEGLNSSVTIIALDSNTARLEIDINGDDAVDVVIDVTWVDLMAAA